MTKTFLTFYLTHNVEIDMEVDVPEMRDQLNLFSQLCIADPDSVHKFTYGDKVVFVNAKTFVAASILEVDQHDDD